MFIHLFGSDFFNREELACKVQDVEDRYYRFLARCALNGYGRDFWEFHRKGLNNVGQKLSYWRLAYYILSIIANKAMNPKNAVESLWQRAMKRRD
jgi:hypothetical protein